MGKNISFNKSILIRALFLVMLFSLMLMPVVGSASLLDQKRAELDKLQGRIGEYEGLAEEKESQADTLENKIAAMNARITQFKLRLQLTHTKIEETNLTIGELSDQISKARKELARQKEILGQAIKYIYEEGETPFVETLFSSVSFSEILDRTEYLHTAEMKIEKTMAEINRLKKELEEKRKVQQKKKKKLVRLNKDLTSQKDGLESERSAKNSLLAQTRGAEAAYQDKVDSLAARAQQVVNEMANLERASRGGSGGRVDYCPARPSSFNFSWPSTGGINCDYYCYPGHTGVDFSAGSGSAYAAASGTVVAVDRSWPSWFNVRYPHYGNYVKIAHAEGFYTLYGHLQPNIRVSPGQHVSAGQAIGTIGNTGYSTGTHLHFEIRQGASTPTNPMCYY